jgi:hypothetical protein
MRTSYISILVFSLLLPSLLKAQEGKLLIKGTVVSETENKAISGVVIRLSNSPYSTLSNQQGEFILMVPKKNFLKLFTQHLSYETSTKEIRVNNRDTLIVNFQLSIKTTTLEGVSVTSVHKPETLVGKPNYGIYDFDFFEDKLILLASTGNLKNAQIQLSDYSGKISSSYQLPKEAGEAKQFYHDYESYTNVICKDSIFRLEVINNDLLMRTIPQADFEKYHKHISDTANGNFYYSNQWEKYPSFNYYVSKPNDSVATLLKTISNADLLNLYNFEYYHLPPRMQLEARRMADYYKTDVHIVAAMMSGFTNSYFYEPLYAPLFVLRDTICIFNHHNDFLYHYTKENKLIDSVKIGYHHPKNWREWKKKLVVDEAENKVYAFFSKDGHNYLKQINHQTGKEMFTFKLQHHSADKIKIKEGYVYYIYRPFGSTQEKFLYRERIE